MSTLTSNIKKRITADWHSRLPRFTAHRPMWLLRRCGAVVQGVLLERNRSNSHYQPLSHVHCLLERSSHITLALRRPLRTPRTHAPDWIKVTMHSQRWEDAVLLLESESVLPLTRALSQDEIITTIASNNRTPTLGDEYALAGWANEIKLLIWVGRLRHAASACTEAITCVSSWPQYVQERYGGTSTVADSLASLLELTQAEIEHERLENVELLGLAEIPEEQL